MDSETAEFALHEAGFGGIVSAAADDGRDEDEFFFCPGAEEVEVAAFVGLKDVVDVEAWVAS